MNIKNPCSGKNNCSRTQGKSAWVINTRQKLLSLLKIIYSHFILIAKNILKKKKKKKSLSLSKNELNLETNACKGFLIIEHTQVTQVSLFKAIVPIYNLILFIHCLLSTVVYLLFFRFSKGLTLNSVLYHSHQPLRYLECPVLSRFPSLPPPA